MKIREMTLEDIGAVAGLDRADSLTPWDETSIFTYFIRDDAILLVAEEEDAIVGFAAALLTPPDADVLDITVSSACRRRGYGESLLRALTEGAASRGVTTVFLEVRESNEAARNLYRKSGFREIGIRRNYYTSPSEDGISMSLSTEP